MFLFMWRFPCRCHRHLQSSLLTRWYDFPTQKQRFQSVHRNWFQLDVIKKLEGRHFWAPPRCTPWGTRSAFLTSTSAIVCGLSSGRPKSRTFPPVPFPSRHRKLHSFRNFLIRRRSVSEDEEPYRFQLYTVSRSVLPLSENDTTRNIIKKIAKTI